MNITILPSLDTHEKIKVIYKQDMSLSEFHEFLHAIRDSELSMDDKKQMQMFSLHELSTDEEHFIKANVEKIHGLVLDLDKSDMVKFYKKFDHYFPNVGCIIYTTHSHKNEPCKHCFRAIVEFVEPLNVDEYKYFIRGFYHEYSLIFGEDESGYTLARRFILPCPTSKIFFKKGKQLETLRLINIGKEIIMTEEAQQRIKERGIQYKDISTDSKTYFKRAIEKKASDFYKGNRDNWLSKRIYFLKQNNCDKYVALELLQPYLDQIHNDKEMLNKFKRQLREM